MPCRRRAGFGFPRYNAFDGDCAGLAFLALHLPPSPPCPTAHCVPAAASVSALAAAPPALARAPQPVHWRPQRIDVFTCAMSKKNRLSTRRRAHAFSLKSALRTAARLPLPARPFLRRSESYSCALHPRLGPRAASRPAHRVAVHLPARSGAEGSAEGAEGGAEAESQARGGRCGGRARQGWPWRVRSHGWLAGTRCTHTKAPPRALLQLMAPADAPTAADAPSTSGLGASSEYRALESHYERPEGGTAAPEPKPDHNAVKFQRRMPRLRKGAVVRGIKVRGGRELEGACIGGRTTAGAPHTLPLCALCRSWMRRRGSRWRQFWQRRRRARWTWASGVGLCGARDGQAWRHAWL